LSSFWRERWRQSNQNGIRICVVEEYGIVWNSIKQAGDKITKLLRQF
jgi:hypothetical protein